jgi:hypothetical protein
MNEYLKYFNFDKSLCAVFEISSHTLKSQVTKSSTKI